MLGRMGPSAGLVNAGTTRSSRHSREGRKLGGRGRCRESGWRGRRTSRASQDENRMEGLLIHEPEVAVQYAILPTSLPPLAKWVFRRKSCLSKDLREPGERR